MTDINTLRADAAALLAEVQVPYDTLYDFMPVITLDGIEFAPASDTSLFVSYRHLTWLRARAAHLVMIVNRKRISSANLIWAHEELARIRCDLIGA